MKAFWQDVLELVKRKSVFTYSYFRYCDFMAEDNYGMILMQDMPTWEIATGEKSRMLFREAFKEMGIPLEPRFIAPVLIHPVYFDYPVDHNSEEP